MFYHTDCYALLDLVSHYMIKRSLYVDHMSIKLMFKWVNAMALFTRKGVSKTADSKRHSAFLKKGFEPMIEGVNAFEWLICQHKLKDANILAQAHAQQYNNYLLVLRSVFRDLDPELAKEKFNNCALRQTLKNIRTFIQTEKLRLDPRNLRKDLRKWAKWAKWAENRT